MVSRTRTLGALALQYPMYVVRVADFMRMSDARPHQFLKAQGVAAEFRPLSSTAAFVSHQWCGVGRADPHFRQLRVLQGMFARAAAGTLRIGTDPYSRAFYTQKVTVRQEFLRTSASWAIWWDYFSVPQAEGEIADQSGPSYWMGDLGRAVSSLPAYVSACEVFFVLAPVMEHEDGHVIDYKSWKKRGWCRLERLARQLSLGSTATLLVTRTDAVVEVGAHDYLLEPVGLGEFSVEADKARLAPIVRGLISRKIKALVAAGCLEDYHHLMSWSPMLMMGLGLPWQSAVWPDASGLSPASAPAEVVGQFWELLRLEGPQSRDLSAALLVAAGLGEAHIVRALLDARADVACRRVRKSAKFFTQKFDQPIHVAAQRGHLEVISVLLEHRASAHARNRLGATPLAQAAIAGSCPALELLVERRADLGHRSRSGSGILDNASTFGRLDAVQQLLAWGMRPARTSGGFSTLHCAALFGAGGDVVHALLDARADVDENASAPFCGLAWMILTTSSLPYLLGRRDAFAVLYYHACGATPLQMALLTDNMVEVQVLLRVGADPGVRNARGASANDLAALVGAKLSC